MTPSNQITITKIDIKFSQGHIFDLTLYKEVNCIQ